MDGLRSLAISLEEEDRADLGGYIAVVLQKLANMNELFLGERVRKRVGCYPWVLLLKQQQQLLGSHTHVGIIVVAVGVIVGSATVAVPVAPVVADAVDVALAVGCTSTHRFATSCLCPVEA